MMNIPLKMIGKKEVKMKEINLTETIKLTYMHAWLDCEMNILTKQNTLIQTANVKELERKAAEFANSIVNEKA